MYTPPRIACEEGVVSLDRETLVVRDGKARLRYHDGLAHVILRDGSQKDAARRPPQDLGRVDFDRLGIAAVDQDG